MVKIEAYAQHLRRAASHLPSENAYLLQRHRIHTRAFIGTRPLIYSLLIAVNSHLFTPLKHPAAYFAVSLQTHALCIIADCLFQLRQNMPSGFLQLQLILQAAKAATGSACCFKDQRHQHYCQQKSQQQLRQQVASLPSAAHG